MQARIPCLCRDAGSNTTRGTHVDSFLQRSQHLLSFRGSAMLRGFLSRLYSVLGIAGMYVLRHALIFDRTRVLSRFQTGPELAFGQGP